MAAAQESVAPFPPPPHYYEEFQPLSNKDWKPPAPPPPIVGPYVVLGTMYDTEFAPQAPSAAIAPGLNIPAGSTPVQGLRALNASLPEEYTRLLDQMIDRPVLCTSEADKQHIIRIDQQREKVEGIIKSMYDCMARFRPFQARQGLIVALRAQIEQRKKQTAILKECREKAEELIKSTTGELSKAHASMAQIQETAANPEKASVDDKEARGRDAVCKDQEKARESQEELERESKRRRIEGMIAKIEKLKKT